VSSESVVKTLKLNPKDDEGFNELLGELGAPEDKNTYEKLG